MAQFSDNLPDVGPPLPTRPVQRPDGMAQRPRLSLWIVGLAPLLAQLVGSAFNIWYNVTRVQPLLTPEQKAFFTTAILVYNLLVYPVGTAVWVYLVLSLGQPLKALREGTPISDRRLAQARRRAINLPWLGAAIAGISWFGCIPTFLLALKLAPGTPDYHVFWYLPISLIISALIAITHGFFAIEILTQRLLYPVLFQGVLASKTPGARALSLKQRGLLVVISAGICPIISLLLLVSVPPPEDLRNLWFSLAVGVIGIGFGLVSAWMLGRVVGEPVFALKQASQRVVAGDFTTRIALKRADEFGPLIEEFNAMVAELQEKQHLQAMFGRHVGQKAAQQILQRDPGLGGVEQNLTVLFADLRNFTARSSVSAPQQTVTLLNRFLTVMVEIVEQRHGGMVNKFLGDGFMALFGVGDGDGNHALQAVQAGQDMLSSLVLINAELAAEGELPLGMGVGIHTGLAVVGSIGSPERLEYTAIGDTVNIASRVESLTKQMQVPLLFTQETRQTLPPTIAHCELPPQMVKGRTEPVLIYTLAAIAQPSASS